MLMLLFLVLFGPKKSALNTYILYWNLKLKNFLYLFYSFNINTKNGNYLTYTNFYNLVPRLTLARFQLTSVTSRLTVYVLFSFWCFFLFFGNFLLSTLLNFNSLSETIFSSTFTTLKQHVIFTTTISNTWLSDTIFFYILIITTFSIFFLLNLRYTFTYNYFYLTYVFDLLILLIIVCIWLL